MRARCRTVLYVFGASLFAIALLLIDSIWRMLKMQKEQIERLHKKLVATQKHLMETEDKKKKMADGFNQEIKGAKGRIKDLTEAIDSKYWEPLVDSNWFDEDELDILQNGERYHLTN